MIDPSDLTNRAVPPRALTDRQRQAEALVQQYLAAAHEMPSAGWLARRLSISRQRAREIMETIKTRSGRG